VNPERFELVKRLLLTLEELPASERSAWLDRACAGDDELREEVESLMTDETPSIMLTGGLATRIAPMMADDRAALGRQIGPYRLIDVLGEGGMGVVYRAEQTSPIRREVALKLVPLGMDTSRVVARFESERQALAMMNHPYIAQALEAAAGDDGRPYFVMELVDGEPVTEYCAREKPPLAVRLQLFLQICEAIQHAHQRGIIHRDLKPSNVLLTKQGTNLVPKIIDFGIATAVGETESRKLLSTMAGQMIGTPEYMSPEQAGVIDAGLDTRTDVYSLGVMLYELVSGRRPYELKKRTAIELERALRAPPPAPGLGDIDAVALMAMERKPDDRYSSVEQLADDVRCVLEHRPVRARTQTWTYRAQKFVRRHAASVATAALVVVLVVIGAIGIVVQRNRAVASELRAVTEATRAKAEAEKASEVSRFLVDLFRESDPANARGASVTARELLDRGAGRIATELASQDVVRATLMTTIGVVYRALGMVDEAETITTDALGVRRRALGAEHADVAEALDNLGQLARDRTRYEQAEQLHREALAMRRKLLPPGDAGIGESAANLALALRERAKYDEARPLAQEGLAIRRQKLGPEHTSTLASMNVLADIQASSGHGAEAEQLYREVLAVRRRTLPADDPKLAISLNNLAWLTQGRAPVEAEQMFREALAIRKKVLSPIHSDYTTSLVNLAGLVEQLGRLDEAEALLREALAADRRRTGGQHMDVAVDLNNLGGLLKDRGRLDEAGRMYRESLAIRIALQGENHPSVATMLNNIGELRLTQGALDDAERALRRSMAIRVALKIATQPRQADTLIWLGRVFEARGRLADARAQYNNALDVYRGASALLALGHLTTVENNAAGAEVFLTEALSLRRQSSTGRPAVGVFEAALGECLLRQSKLTEAEPLLLSAVQSVPKVPTSALYDRRATLGLLVQLYEKSGKRDDAARYRAELQVK
jgi:tetratricopeptide (TPR) repeat protein